MKLFLKSILPQLKMYSQSLDKTSLLVEQPWVIVNTTSSYQKLIFKRNGELIMSTDGKVGIGTWEYLASAKSILLDRNTDKVLLNHGFMDEKVLLLRVDGRGDDFFLLANENTLPSLDVLGYLKSLRYDKLNIAKVELNNGMQLEVHEGTKKRIAHCRGLKVSIEAEQIPDGRYIPKSKSYAFEVINNTIKDVLFFKYHTLQEGKKIEIRQKGHDEFQLGDQVLINDLPIENGTYTLKNRKKLIIEDGKIIKIKGRWW